MTISSSTPAAVPVRPARRLSPAGAAQLRTGAVIVLALAVIGVVLGLVWLWWSPARPIGFVIAPHAVQPDETEAFVAADGRFAALTAGVGLLAGVVVWCLRSVRGPVAALALAVGGLAGALLTETVGHAFGGGASSGKTQTVITHLPLSVHMTGLRVLEAAAAVVVYGLLVSFAASDDLGRPDRSRPDHSRLDPSRPADEGAAPPSPGSVGLGGDPQHGWGHGDGAGALHEPDLAP